MRNTAAVISQIPNKWFLRYRLNCSKPETCRRLIVKLFHIRGPATAKLLSPLDTGASTFIFFSSSFIFSLLSFTSSMLLMIRSQQVSASSIWPWPNKSLAVCRAVVMLRSFGLVNSCSPYSAYGVHDFPSLIVSHLFSKQICINVRSLHWIVSQQSHHNVLV